MIGKGVLRRDTDSVIYIQKSILSGAELVLKGTGEKSTQDLVIRFHLDDKKGD